MPYEPLTPEIFIALQPAFAEVPDETVQLYIDLASRFVDRSWSEADYQHAWAAMTCHLLTLNGVGGSVEAELATAGGSRVTRMKSGQLDLTFSESQRQGGSDVSDWLSESQCGRFYLMLLKMNRGGPHLLTGGGFGCQSGYAKDVPNGQSAPWFRGAGSDRGFG